MPATGVLTELGAHRLILVKHFYGEKQYLSPLQGVLYGSKEYVAWI